MNLTRNFSVSKSESSVRSRVVEYFLQEGYQQLNESELTFKRGTFWSSFWHTNAVKWKCVVKVILKSEGPMTDVIAEYNFNPADNYTEVGGKFWEAKAGEFEDALNNTDYTPVNAKAFTKETNRELRGILMATAIGVLVFFLVFLGASILLSKVLGLDTGISYMIGGGIGGGVGGWLYTILWKKFAKSKSATESD